MAAAYSLTASHKKQSTMKNNLYTLTCEGNNPIAILAPSETIARINGIQMFKRPNNQEVFSERIQPIEIKLDPGEIDKCPACGLRDVKPMMDLNEEELDEILDLNNITLLEAARLCVCGQCGYTGEPEEFVQEKDASDLADDYETYHEMMRDYYAEREL